MATVDASGIPLAHALATSSDPDSWAEYSKLIDAGYGPGPSIWFIGAPETESDRKRSRCARLEEDLRGAFKEKLERGEILATALDSRKPIDSPRAHVPAEAWQFLEIDFEKSTAAGEGFLLTGLRVIVGHADSRLMPEKEITPRERSSVGASTKCREWMKQLRASRKGPFKKGDLFAEARRLFGNSLSQREFERIWKACASKKWMRPGRKSKRRIDTPK